MLDFGFYNMDCMQGMAEFPDKYFDLAIVDPPYGINVGSASMGAVGGGVAPHKNRSAKNKVGGYKTIGGAKPFGNSAIQIGGGSLHQSQNLQGVR